MAKETEFKILFLKKAKASVLVILSKHVKNGHCNQGAPTRTASVGVAAVVQVYILLKWNSSHPSP